MQKRLLALVATVAVVLSMFAGVAFAASDLTAYTPAVAKITAEKTEVDKDTASKYTKASRTAFLTAYTALTDPTNKLSYDESTAQADIDAAVKEINAAIAKLVEKDEITIRLNKEQIIGSQQTPGSENVGITVLRAGKPATGIDFDITIAGVDGTSYTFAAKNGYASVPVPTGLPVQDLTVKAAFAAGTELDDKGVLPIDPAYAELLAVRYNVTVTPALDFTFTGEQSMFYMSGKVTDRNGNPVYVDALTPTTVSLCYVDKDGVWTSNIKSGVTNAKGEFGFVVNDLLNVKPIGISIKEGSGAEVVHRTGEVKPLAATLSVTPASVVRINETQTFTLAGSGFLNGSGDVKLSLWKGTAPKTSDTTLVDVAFASLDKGAFKNVTFTWEPTVAGTYTLVAEQGPYKAEAKITVSDPVTNNLVGAEELKELPVGPKEFGFGVDADNKIYLVRYIPGGTPEFVTDFVYTVLVDGKATDIVKNTGKLSVTSTKLAARTIQVQAYGKDKEGAYTELVYNQTFTAQVTGWDVEMDVKQLTVNEAQTLTFVVKDKSGAPVNNATIEIDGTAFKLDPNTYNAQNGTYVLKDVKLTTVKDYTVKVYLGTEAKMRAKLTLAVVGKPVYSVSSDVATLLQGKTQDVKLTITQDGKAVTPARIKLIDADDDVTDSAFSFVSDGVYKLEAKVLVAGDLVVRAENADGTLCGEVKLEVVAPKLVLIDEEAANVTDNFKTKVNFKIVDPRDDSVLKNEIKVVANKYVGALVAYDANNIELPVTDKTTTVVGAEEYKLTILAKEADFDTAAEDEKTALVQIKVLGGLVDGSFEVKPAAIESDPEMIVIGANNNLTLTYKDANGKVLAGRTIKAGTVDLGKTDENGQVIYPVGVVAGPVEVTGITDVKGVSVKKTIKIGYDAEAPKVTCEADGDKATIIITDNVRLVRINIDGKDVDFWPGAKYEHKVTLKPGVNKFAVKAQDSNDLVLDEVVEIEYVAESVVLKDEQVKRQGEFVFVQLRQFEELGAQVGWKAETKTATFIVGETKVEVTIGSQTAKVNGEAVQMPAAPFIANDRTYVPTRFIAEQLGWDVHWAAGDVITITLP